MKTQLLLMILLGFCGCGSKQKLLHQTKESSSVLRNKQTELVKQSQHFNYTQQNDSVLNNYWFKLYPKGEVQFADGSFKGELDSLIGYGKSLKLQKLTNLQQDDSILQHKAITTAAIFTAKEVKAKEKKKLEIAWWFCLIPALIIGFYLFKIRRYC